MMNHDIVQRRCSNTKQKSSAASAPASVSTQLSDSPTTIFQSVESVSHVEGEVDAEIAANEAVPVLQRRLAAIIFHLEA